MTRPCWSTAGQTNVKRVNGYKRRLSLPDPASAHMPGVGRRHCEGPEPVFSVNAPMEDAVAAGCDWLTPVGVGHGGVFGGRRTGTPFFAGEIDVAGPFSRAAAALCCTCTAVVEVRPARSWSSSAAKRSRSACRS
jgi:hypothetical protein